MILVNTIYRIRESLQWDQEKMADEMNVTAVTLKRWENEDGIPGKAAQEKLISIWQKEIFPWLIGYVETIAVKVSILMKSLTVQDRSR